jgi:hypothetical protein
VVLNRFQWRALPRWTAVLCAASAITSTTLAELPALRPELNRPLQVAQEYIKTGRYRDALRKIHETDAIQSKANTEVLLIERMRVAAAMGAGDMETLLQSFTGMDSSTMVPSAEKLRMVENIATLYYRAQQYALAVPWYQRYFKDGGTSNIHRGLMAQALYLSGDGAAAAKELTKMGVRLLKIDSSYSCRWPFSKQTSPQKTLLLSGSCTITPKKNTGVL